MTGSGQTIAEDAKVRKNALRVRVALLTGVGGLLVLRALLWDIDMESVLRPEFYREPTPHEAYLLALRHGGGEHETLELAWEAAALRVIEAPLSVPSAYEEVSYLPTEAPQALGLRIHIPEGQRLHVHVAKEGGIPYVSSWTSSGPRPVPSGGRPAFRAAK